MGVLVYKNIGEWEYECTRIWENGSMSVPEYGRMGI